VPVLAIIDSHVVRVAKPAAEIFSHALEPLNVDPRNALYVGDTVRYDVNGAVAAGLQPVHQDPLGLCSGTNHRHIKVLKDVLELL
jgi:putative hydrolase of the HAD superfamily